jgi:Secretion system C-terminal sorting domain
MGKAIHKSHYSLHFSTKQLDMKKFLHATKKISFSAFILCVCLLSAQTAFSQVRTWDGGGDGTTWSDLNNWDANTLPVSTDSVIIIAGANVAVTSGTETCRKLGIYGAGSNQGKVTVNAGATLNVNASATNNVNPGHSAITLYGGMIDNKGTMTVSGRTNIDAIRFDNPTSGTLSSTYMGTGAITFNTSTGQGTGSTWASSGNNGTSMTFAQTSGTATFTVGGTYTFTLNTGGTKSVFYCSAGDAQINGTGTITTAGAIRSIRVIPTASANPNLTIGQNVIMNLSSDVSSVAIGIVLLSTSAASTSASMTNKGTLNFSGTSATLINSIYMENALAATNTTTFTNEGTININGAFATTTPTIADGGIAMVTTSTGGGNSGFGNAFTNSGAVNFNTTMSGTSPKPLFYCTSAPKNLITNSGNITIGTFGTLTIGLRLGDSKTIVNNTGTITVGAGSITAGTANAMFNNNMSGILNLNSGVSSTNVEFFNTGGTFNVNANQRVGRFTINNGTVAIADGFTFTTYTLTLTSGNIPLGTGKIVIESGGSASGSATSYVATNGTGVLSIEGFTGSKTFPVGTATAYAPVIINNSATSRHFSVKVGSTFSGTPAVTNKMVQLQWDITPSDMTANNADLTLQWPASAQGSSFNPAAATEIAHYTGTWSEFKLATVSGSGPYTAMASGFTSFSPFAVANQNALSVELTTFKATPLSKTNLLTWETAAETNNKGFDVQRQTRTGAWESLGFVDGVGKASTYTFEDKGPLSISYYRLRQVDFDGKETLSKIVSVSQDSKGRISITPNPTSDKATISLAQNDVTNQTATIILYDMTGRQVLTQRATGEAIQLDLSDLAKGMYVVTVQSNNAIYQQKIVRQ